MRKLFLILMTLMACTWNLQAQTRTYHGTVLDAANGEPLIGATVMPIGGGQGTAADIEGNFTLSVPSSVKKAKVSYVGYEPLTVDLKDGMVVKLTSSSASLDDLVVVAYGTASKESLTGSVAVVGAKEIEERPVTSVTTALEGNAPGVQVNNSTGTPGSSPTIRIRGFNSINGDNSPLYVVDGVPYSGSINDLNPADIESMSVLKDAASSALYGNRGANGVVLITTKKAKKAGVIDVTLTIRQGMYNRGLPFYDRLDPNTWMQAQFDSRVNGDARINNPYAPTTGEAIDSRREYYAKGAIVSRVVRNNIYGVPDNELFNPETGQFIGGNPLPGYTDLDWWNAVSQNGYRQEYNVNAAGATENFNMFASVGYLKEDGYVIGTDFDRFTARVNANFQPTKYLKMGVNLSATQQESMTGSVESSNLDGVNNPFLTQFTSPVLPYYLHDKDGNIIYENGSPVWNTESYNQGTNVAWEMRLNDNNYSKTAIDGMAYITAVLPYGFELTARGQMFRNKTTITEYSNNVVGSQAGVGMLQKEYDNYKSHTFMQTLTWNHDYGMNHIDVLLDHESYNDQVAYDFVQKSGQQMDGYLDFNRFADTEYVQSGATKVRLESYLGRVRYNYNQQYFVEASVRRDGTSRFAKDCRWGTFWSLGGSWIISKEKFMESTQTWLNYLKLRASYGSVGNDSSAPAYANQTYFGWSTYAGGKVNSLVPAYLGTPNLKWEATKTFDLALEGSLFNDRFNFTVGYFNKSNTDLLFKFVLPTSVGSMGGTGAGTNPSVWRNVGSMLNYGWELQFGVDIIRNKDITWDFSIDATFLKNKVKKLPDGHDLPGQNLFYNKSLYQIKTYTWAGVDQLTGQSMYEINPDSPDFISYDDNGQMLYDEASFNAKVEGARNDSRSVFIEKDGKYYTSNTTYATRQLQGEVLPTVYGSFGTNVSWKGINLGLLFTYSLGGKTLDSNYASLMGGAGQTAGALHKDVLKSWTGAPEGMTEDSPNRIDPNGVPELNYLQSQYNNASSSRFITSSSYLTLKNINLSYSLPMSWRKAMLLKDINIGVSIDNVFIAAKRKGMNPTYGFGGGQGAYYVPARVFAFQLSAKF